MSAYHTPPNKLHDVEDTLAVALAKIAFFMSPRVVNFISKANAEWWTTFAHKQRLDGIETNYFYPGSACSFPGIRRKAVKAERGLKAQKYHLEYKCVLDLNWFPRELWAFTCTGKRYNAKNWSASRLGEFELAHILPHKETEIVHVKRHFQSVPDDAFPSGLFTCASNTVLLPKGSARPTDGMGIFAHSF